MNTSQVLSNWERLNTRHNCLDVARTHWEQVAWNDIALREQAEQMREMYTEELFKVTMIMDELEQQFAGSLHHAAEIVNGLALVLGWREW